MFYGFVSCTRQCPMPGVLTILLSFKKCSFNSIAHYSLSNKTHSHQRLKRLRLLIWRSLSSKPEVIYRLDILLVSWESKSNYSSVCHVKRLDGSKSFNSS